MQSSGLQGPWGAASSDWRDWLRRALPAIAPACAGTVWYVTPLQGMWQAALVSSFIVHAIVIAVWWGRDKIGQLTFAAYFVSAGLVMLATVLFAVVYTPIHGVLPPLVTSTELFAELPAILMVSYLHGILLWLFIEPRRVRK